MSNSNNFNCKTRIFNTQGKSRNSIKQDTAFLVFNTNNFLFSLNILMKFAYVFFIVFLYLDLLDLKFLKKYSFDVKGKLTVRQVLVYRLIRSQLIV